MSVIYSQPLPVVIKENIPFIFPEPLPPVIKEHITDPTGFTAVEKTTLRNAWRIIKRYQRKHARNIFLNFYTENEYMIDLFRDGKRNLINTHSLHSHAQTILRIYDRLIEEGFENYAMFHTILTEVAASHKRIMENETQEAVEAKPKKIVKNHCGSSKFFEYTTNKEAKNSNLHYQFPSEMSVIFPKPLPTIIAKSEPDESGFTALEKITLQNAWRVIKRHQRKHARNVFLDFFTKNEYIIEHFREAKRGKLHMNSLHSHPEKVFETYDRLIEECLDNPAMFHTVLTEVYFMHSRVWAKGDFMELIKIKTEAIEEYINNVLKMNATPTFYVAIKKLNEIIQSYFR